ncbi:MAG: hypothetical protein ABFS34_13285 [Gemmatimonadota bacterium]
MSTPPTRRPAGTGATLPVPARRADPSSPSAAPRTVPDARAEIAATRARLAANADLLKGRLGVQRAHLRKGLDLPAKLRELVSGKELLALAGAFVGGLALGLLRGRKRRARFDDDD